MISYRLSVAADADIAEIARDSILRWGLERAEAYLTALHHALEHLSRFPRAGRDIGDLRAGYRRLEHESHAIFYQVHAGGVFVVRVLHRRMEPKQHL